jgi:hypothetical protein
MLGGKIEHLGRACLDTHTEHQQDGNNLCARPGCGAKYHNLGPFGGYWTPEGAKC